MLVSHSVLYALFICLKKKNEERKQRESNHIFYSQINKYQNIQYNMKVGKILFLNVDGGFFL